MKLSIEIKDENQTTKYTVDTTQAERSIQDVATKAERFLKDTFKKETINKETKKTGLG
jgi:hypothetical protein